MNKRSWLIVADLVGLLGCLWMLAAYPAALSGLHDIVLVIVGAFGGGLAAAHSYVYGKE